MYKYGYACTYSCNSKDATGNKLRKVTTDNTVSPARVTTTDYIAGFVYENNAVQFLNHEEVQYRRQCTGRTAWHN
jgi:hypothetical protein